MASELTPQSIREVRFREKLRGYHPEDVDAFVAQVASTVESLQRRLGEGPQAPSAAAAAESVAASTGEAAGGEVAASDIEESLRRTLVLAQRTADMAVKEAQEEAARMISEAEAQRAQVLAEVDELRTRTKAELEHELSGYRQRLYDEREALQRDVAALQAYVSQERERLRIYFSEQLDRVTSGEPTVAPAPELEGPPREEPAEPADAPAGVEQQPGAGDATTPPEDADAASPQAGDSNETDGTNGDGQTAADDDDPYLAELRRAVSDNEPLGPRDDDVDLPPKDERDLDIFNEDEGGGRFLRRRR